MSIAINVVVTCTKRKTVAVPERLKFRHVRKAPIEKKIELWQERLGDSRLKSVPVRQLYSGDHWKIARAMENSRSYRGIGVLLWVASAGYGLVSMDRPLRPYSATFSSDHPDSISKNTTSDDRQATYRRWWELMSRWEGPRINEPRTITEIVQESPNSPLLVIASENYLLAIEDDLQMALAELNNTDLLSIFSAGCKKTLNGLVSHLVPCDARLQRAVGGALTSLNMRAAHKAIAECRRSLPTYSVLRRKFSRLLREQPKLLRFERKSMTDAAVRGFLRRELLKNSEACHTPLLRKLRDSGQACEQKRFANLFREVQEQLNGS